MTRDQLSRNECEVHLQILKLFTFTIPTYVYTCHDSSPTKASSHQSTSFSIYPSSHPFLTLFQTTPQAPLKSPLVQPPPNKHQLALSPTTTHTRTPIPTPPFQIHNLKNIPHALNHFDLAIGGEEAAFESVDRERGCGFGFGFGFRGVGKFRFGFRGVDRMRKGKGAREDGFPEEGAEPGFEACELVGV